MTHALGLRQKKWGHGSGLLVVLVGSMMGGCSRAGSDTATVAGTAGSVAPAAATTPPVVVTATELFADYHANEVAADEKYKGRNLRVTGTIASIDKDPVGGMALRLNGAADTVGLEVVLATIERSQKAKVVTLSKGSLQTVSCVGEGMVIGSPILGACLLDDPPAAPDVVEQMRTAKVAMAVCDKLKAARVASDCEVSERGGADFSIPLSGGRLGIGSIDYVPNEDRFDRFVAGVRKNPALSSWPVFPSRKNHILVILIGREAHITLPDDIQSRTKAVVDAL